MDDLLVTINIRLEYDPDEEKISMDVSPKSKTQMDIVLKSKLFRNVSGSS